MVLLGKEASRGPLGRSLSSNGVRVLDADFGGVRGPTARPSVPLTSGSCLWRCRIKSRAIIEKHDALQILGPARSSGYLLLSEPTQEEEKGGACGPAGPPRDGMGGGHVLRTVES